MCLSWQEEALWKWSRAAPALRLRHLHLKHSRALWKLPPSYQECQILGTLSRLQSTLLLVNSDYQLNKSWVFLFCNICLQALFVCLVQVLESELNPVSTSVAGLTIVLIFLGSTRCKYQFICTSPAGPVRGMPHQRTNKHSVCAPLREHYHSPFSALKAGGQFCKSLCLAHYGQVLLQSHQQHWHCHFIPFNSPWPRRPSRPMTTLHGSDVICTMPMHHSHSFCRPILRADNLLLLDLEQEENQRQHSDFHPMLLIHCLPSTGILTVCAVPDLPCPLLQCYYCNDTPRRVSTLRVSTTPVVPEGGIAGSSVKQV